MREIDLRTEDSGSKRGSDGRLVEKTDIKSYYLDVLNGERFQNKSHFICLKTSLPSSMTYTSYNQELVKL